jgi:beta-N-acetylhexosaminidase
MSLQLSLPVLCGQLIVGGFEGETLPPRFARALHAGKRGGAILFKRNLPSVDHARALCGEIASTTRPDLPPFLGVDEEGGRVSRLRAPVLRLPPMRKLAGLGDASLLERCGRLLGQQLAAAGFNLNFAPVLDVDTNPDNPIIGDRSFGRDADAVCLGALAFYQGLSAHVLGCGKHFPGHGDTTVDSHLGLPVIEHDRARLLAVECMPFLAAARSNMDSLMTAHILVKALDPEVPATLSKAVCTDLLRRELGFQGVLFSDDLEMRAVADRYPVEESAVQAIEAGCDVLLICRSEDLQDQALEALIRRAEKDQGFRERCTEALVRGLNARKRKAPNPVFDDARFRAVMGASAALEAELRQRGVL